MREIKGLRWVKALDARPRCIPIGRPRGAKKAGVRYEEQLGASAPWLIRGQWFEFEDREGRGFCQMDFIWHYGDRRVAVLEAKYTWTEEGHRQLERLYVPVLEGMGWERVWGVVVCKKLLSSMSRVKIVSDLRDAQESALDGRRVVLHWIGIGPLIAPRSIVHQTPLAPSLRVA